MSRPLRVADRAALAVISLLILAASAASFAESYRGLLDWAARHGLHGIWQAAFPAQLDCFIAVGEMAVLVGLIRDWKTRDRIAGWAVAGLGLAASVAGNVGHVGSGNWTVSLTAAVPPLAAAASLAVGFGVFKRVAAAGAAAPLSGAIAAGVVPAGPVLVDPVAAAAGSARPAITSGQTRHRGRGKGKRQQTRLTPAQQDAAVYAAMQSDPELSKAGLARLLGVSERTVGRALERISTPAAGTT